MRVCLGMTVFNEIKFLLRHLKMMSNLFDGVLISDGGSTDGSVEYMTSFPNVLVIPGDFGQGKDWREDEAKNVPVLKAEEYEFDWIVNLDADEIMTAKDVINAKKFMWENNTFLIFPRIEFYGDTDHYRQSPYPDFQGRSFKLGLGYRWVAPIHSIIKKEGDPKSAWEMGYGTIIPTSQIWHYGWALDFERRFKRYNPETPIPDPLANPDVKFWYGIRPI